MASVRMLRNLPDASSRSRSAQDLQRRYSSDTPLRPNFCTRQKSFFKISLGRFGPNLRASFGSSQSFQIDDRITMSEERRSSASREPLSLATPGSISM